MADEPDKKTATAPLFDPQIQTENIAFAPTEMAACTICKRPNPPTRTNCIYCGEELEKSSHRADLSRYPGRVLEQWENGYNLIIIEKFGEIETANLVQILSLDKDELSLILNLDCSLPLKRVESEAEAASIKTILGESGLKCIVVSDVDLAVEKPPTRLSAVKLLANRIILHEFNSGRELELESDKLALIVTGVISKSRIDSVEKRRRSADSVVLQESATVSDDSVVDLYFRGNEYGFRIRPIGFDFSSLGDDMGMLVRENLEKLISRLKHFGPNAVIVDNYPAVRFALGKIWEVEARTELLGMKKVGVGKSGFGSAITTNNLQQFTKYSRLQWHLYEKQGE